MKISEVRPTYYQNRRELVDQIRDLHKQKEKAESAYRVTGDSKFSDQAASLELSIKATDEAFRENQAVLDSIAEQHAAIWNMEVSKQQGDAMKEEMENMGKIMTVFRRLANGDTVPLSDEKKLAEYDEKMYTMAKNMQAMARQLEKEHEDHDSLWEDEEKKEYPDPGEVADNSEYAGPLPDIEIPEVAPSGSSADVAGADIPSPEITL
ncbi:MAG: hypothetical protein K6E66_04240 [Lachnospiraceae bacterium]|nr:hypothetical protein [Lachnospiraceae bacterium]